MGQFIFDLPQGKSWNETSFWSARVELTGNKTDGNFHRREPGISKNLQRQATAANFSQIITYTKPIHYPVAKTGFYCVGKLILNAIETKSDWFLQAVIPITVQSPSTRRASSEALLHPSYKGSVLFRNTFNGQLPATDYPKVDVNGFASSRKQTLTF